MGTTGSPGGRRTASSAGGSGNDVFTLAGCRNQIFGESGRDNYTNQEICLGADGSKISMGDQDDRVTASYMSEVLLGNGKDILTTRYPGYVHAGSGDDFVDFTSGGDTEIGLGSGTDKVNLEGTSGRRSTAAAEQTASTASGATTSSTARPASTGSSSSTAAPTTRSTAARGGRIVR